MTERCYYPQSVEFGVLQHDDGPRFAMRLKDGDLPPNVVITLAIHRGDWDTLLSAAHTTLYAFDNETDKEEH